MEIYRLRFPSLDRKNETVEMFQCDADHVARAYAAEQLIARNLPSVELWHRSRRLF
jgi:hypothetical protein